MIVTAQQLIRVGHSPDPDDAFMFHALANDKIPTGILRFTHELQDIETLNRRALKGELEVTAVSIHAYSFLLDKYALLPTGTSNQPAGRRLSWLKLNPPRSFASVTSPLPCGRTMTSTTRCCRSPIMQLAL